MNCQQMLAAAPGLTYRQLDFWSSHGWLRARNEGDGTGRSRDYPHSESLVAAVMIRLVRAGLAPAQAALAARGQSIGDGIYITIGAPGGTLTDALGSGATDEYPVIAGAL
jgi:hypothetical protein